MGPTSRHIRTGCVLGLALAAATAAAALTTAGTAAPGGGGIDEQSARVRAIEHELYTLGVGAEQAAARAQDARARADGAERRLASNTKRLREAREAVTISRRRLAERLVSIYKEEPPSLVEVLVTSGGLTSAVTAHEQLSRAGAQDARVLENVRASRARLAQVRTRIEDQREIARREAGRAAAERAQLEQLLGQRSAALAGARAELGRLLAERERQRQLAALAAQQAAQARQLREVAVSAPAGGSSSGAAPTPGASSGGSGSSSGAAPQAPVSAPSPGSTSGIEGKLEQIARCESGGNPGAVSPDGQYRGKYQFHPETWRSVGGSGDPARAPEAEQDRRAADLLRRSGSSPWPVCGS